MKSSRKLLSYILVLISAVALSSCHSHKNVSRDDYKHGKTTHPGVEYGTENGSDGWDYYSSLVINEAKTWLGTPYKYGGSAKKKGTDCSGMTQQVYLTVTGVEIPRNSARQSEYCKKVSNKKVLPGDLVFFNTSGKGVSHVGIYLGNSNMIHASGSKGVMISSLNEEYWQKVFMCCGRVPQMEILAQNYTPKKQKDSKKDKGNKKDKNKKKKGKNQQEDPIYTPGFAEPITTGVIESEYASNSSASGPSADDNASSSHYASNWNETVENSSYNTDYVAKARFKKQPTQPTQPVNVTEVNTPAKTEVASTTTANSASPTQSTSTGTGKLTPPAQHTEVFTNYDQYGGTSISTPTKKEQEEKLYEEAVSTRNDNKVEITSVNSAANTTSDSQKKTAISPAEAFGKGKTTTSTSTNVTPSVPSTKVTTTQTTTVVEEEEEEEENPWMD